MVRAGLKEGRYLISEPEPVGALNTFLTRLREPVGKDGCLVVGFDFPIGLPRAYALPAEIYNFPQALRETFGHGPEWRDFYDVCGDRSEIKRTRPFYPRSATKKGERKHSHVATALGVTTVRELYRRCERATTDRRVASFLFWTLSRNQVGKAAISGWRDVIVPALKEVSGHVKLWPFDGNLATLLGNGRTVLVETYPTEAYRHLNFPSEASSKQNPDWRRARADEILDWSARRSVVLTDEARQQIIDGFGMRKDGEDRFDAFVGLCSMLEVVLGYRDEGAPQSEDVRTIEGWIFGQESEANTPIQLLGYSERGFFNALFFCLKHHPKGASLLQQLLTRATWPGLETVPPSFGRCETVFIEQSFSDFGEPDAVLLMRNGEQRQSLFIEGKRGDHKLAAAWSRFRDCLRGEATEKNLTSNVFSQLYFKQRLAAELSLTGDWKTRLQAGIVFPNCLQTNRGDRLRKIGENPVVLDATGRLKEFVSDPYFLAIVPETRDAVQAAWRNFTDCPIDGWDMRRWGFLSLPEIRDFCREHALVDVLELLRFNRNQLST